MNITESVREYYGRVLQRSADLQTNACCSQEVPAYLRPILAKVSSEVLEKYYGCGLVVPPFLPGLHVLDLGCGSGRDVFLLSGLIGASGTVTGVDMTEEQLDVARRNIDFHTRVFGYEKTNVRIVHGYMEDLTGCGIPENSMDLVVSNCVVNLSPDKQAVMEGIFRVLKPGGELYFSDVFSDRRIPKHLQDDPVLYGECLSGAMYIEDFRRTMESIGIADHRVVESREISINNPELQEKLGNIRFYSRTIRAFRLDLEDRCEDYGQAAVYHGTIPGHEHGFLLDDHHYFETGRVMTVCGNTADMVSATRYGQHFTVYGNKNKHYGLFDCSPPAVSGTTSEAGSSCC